MTITLAILGGVPVAAALWLFLYKEAASFLYDLTGELRLNISSNHFRIWKGWTWHKNEKVQLAPLPVHSREWIIGRKRGTERAAGLKRARIQAITNASNSDADIYRRVKRNHAKLDFDYEKKQFYLKLMGPIRWQLLKDGEDELHKLKEGRLYLSRSMRVWFDQFYLDIEPFEKKPYNPDVSSNNCVFVAFLAYLAWGAGCLLGLPDRCFDSTKLPYCLPIALLAVVAYSLFMNSNEKHLVLIISMAVLTVGYFLWAVYFGTPKTAVDIVLECLPYGTMLALLLQNWKQIHFKGSFLIKIISAASIAFFVKQIPDANIGFGDIGQIIFFLLALLTMRTEDQKVIASNP